MVPVIPDQSGQGCKVQSTTNQTKQDQTTVKTQLQKNLALICPSITIETIWEPDHDMHPDIREDCDGMDDENPDDWQCWCGEVRVSQIINGEVVTGSDGLGGIWVRTGEYPWVSDPDISGYEVDMTVAALHQLQSEEVDAALRYLNGKSANK